MQLALSADLFLNRGTLLYFSKTVSRRFFGPLLLYRVEMLRLLLASVALGEQLRVE